jgi:molybdate transport system regulatory protein
MAAIGRCIAESVVRSDLMPSLSVRLRVDFSADCSIGPGKVALLEAIRASGSLSQAARELRMSYRRAWLLLQSLNTSFAQPVAELSRGGSGGGGASVTPFGAALIGAFRSLESETARRAGRVLAKVAGKVAGKGSSKLKARPVQKPRATAGRR